MIRAALGLLACMGVAAWGSVRELPVAVRTLPNGLRIVVQEDRDIPNVAVSLFFRVGSRNERPGITGISHFLEHMMFNGSKEHGPGEFDRIMERNGGGNNAYTTHDVTVYSDWCSRSSLELVLSMEAERLRNLSFDPAVVESERKVVLAERRTTVENDNFGFLQQELFSVLYRVHPYRWPVLGWVSDIQSWTPEDLRDYFARAYAPGNCVLVAVGDVTSGRLFSLVEKYFAAIPSHALPPPPGPAEPPQKEERRAEFERPAQAPMQLVAYHVPPSAGRDHWALEVAAAVLASGRSSRLYRRLVRQDRAALSVASWVRPSLDPGELTVSVDFRPGADLDKAEHAFDEEIARLQATPVTDHELRAAKTGLRTALARETRTDSGMADALGTYEVYFGDCRDLFSAPDRIERVTASDVERVARLYLRTSNRAVVTLMPSGRRQQGPIR